MNQRLHGLGLRASALGQQILFRSSRCAFGEQKLNAKKTLSLYSRGEQSMSLRSKSVMTIKTNRVLVLAAGMMSNPLLEYLTRNPATSVTVVSRNGGQVQELAKRHRNTNPVAMDIERSEEGLHGLVKAHDLVISLLSTPFHPVIGKLCIKHKKNMLTAIYELPAMKELHKSAKEAGITIFQEVGIDPGISQMLAMECIDSVNEDGGKVESFVSYVGGLPAPEHAENPLRYKFSWSPKGALVNVLNGAKYLMNNKVVEIEPGKLLEHSCPINIFPAYKLEGYPNRDSTRYADLFNIKDAHTILRGTMRYQGFSDVCKGLLKLGLFSNRPFPGYFIGTVTSWRELLSKQIGKSDLSEKELAMIVYDRIKGSDFALDGIKGLGLLSEENVEVQQTPFDTLSHHLSKKLVYNSGERDMILLRNQIGIKRADNTREQHDITLVEYGTPGGDSAMAKTTGITTAIAAEMLLSGEVTQKGNVFPLHKDIYIPMLKKLKAENIAARNVVTKL